MKFQSQKIFLIIFLMSMCAMSANAQKGQQPRMDADPGELAERQTKEMKNFMELTGDQWAQMEALNYKYAEKMQVVLRETGGERSAMRSSMEGLKASKNKEVKAILDKNQYKAYIAYQGEAEERMRESRGGGGRKGGGRPRP